MFAGIDYRLSTSLVLTLRGGYVATFEQERSVAGFTLKSSVDFAPLLYVSALDGTRVTKILDLARELHDEAETRLATPQLNQWIQQMQDEHPAPLFHGYPVRFSYAYQVATQPVTIAIQTNRPQAVDDSYRRFLVNRLRERFTLRVPVRLLFKKKSGATPRGTLAK